MNNISCKPDFCKSASLCVGGGGAWRKSRAGGVWDDSVLTWILWNRGAESSKMKVNSPSWEIGKAGGKLFLKSRLLNGILLWCCLHYILAVGAGCQENEILCCSETVGFYCSQSPFAFGFLLLNSVALSLQWSWLLAKAPCLTSDHTLHFASSWERSLGWTYCAGNSSAAL